MSVSDVESVRDLGHPDPLDGGPLLKHELRHPDADQSPFDELDFSALDAENSELFGMNSAYDHGYMKPAVSRMPMLSPSHSATFDGALAGGVPGHISGHPPSQLQQPVAGQSAGPTVSFASDHGLVQPHAAPHAPAVSNQPDTTQTPASRSAPQPLPGKPLFQVNLAMIRRTMEGVNAVLGVDLGGTEVGESALLDSPTENGDEDSKELGSSKAEMSHVRLISDACGYITASVSRAVLQAAEESMQESRTLGVANPRPKPPIRKKRGGILGFKELAQRASLSPWHFHRVFRFVTGVTPKAYGEALWEYLMIETGFDLENEEMSINLAVKSRGPPEASKLANNITTPSSNSSSPSSPSAQLTIDGLPSQQQSTSSMPSAALAPERGRSSAVSSQSALATAVANGSSEPSAPVGPHGGQMAPGRVRKTSSRSRGARSRSRTRSSSQSQVLASLSIDPVSGDPTASLPVGALPPRGRSFSRVQRPVLNTAGSTPSSVSAQTPSPHDSALPQAQHGQELLAEGLFPEDVGRDGMLLGPSPRHSSALSYDIPDLNTLSLQQEQQQQQQQLPLDGMHHPSSVPSFSPMTSQNYSHAYAHPGARHSEVGPQDLNQDLRSELLDGYAGVAGPLPMQKRHHRRQSTGTSSEYAHVHGHGQPQYADPYNMPLHGSQYANGGIDSRGMASHMHGEHPTLGNSGLSQHQQLYQPPMNTANTASTLVPDQGSTSSSTPQDEPNFQEDLQREMYGAQPDSAKNDQLSDLPPSFYTDIEDKSLYGELDEFSSALIGMNDPPLAMPWGEANTDTYTY